MNDTVTNDISVASHRGKGLKAFLSSESHSNPDEYSSLDNDELPEAKGKQKSSEYEKTRGDHEWTNIDFLTCPSTLVAFSLDEKVWVNVQVERLSDVVWLESPFDFLELDTGKKKLIQNLTRRFKTKGISEGSIRGTGEGHGGNLIILLSGPPGVGKTLTAGNDARSHHMQARI